MFQLTDISKKFFAKKVLNPMTLSVGEGDKVLLSGHNGSGKTTLLKIMSGMMKPTKGEVAFHSKPIWEDVHGFRARIGVLLDEPFLYADVSLMQNLLFFSKLYRVKDAEEKLLHWAEVFSLKHLLHAEVRTFSKGERQKASIIRCMLHEPEILFLDEPLSGLDQRSKQALLNSLSRQKSTVILSAHEDLSSQKWIRRSLFLEGGSLVETAHG